MTGMARCALRLARLITSGPPPKEPKGGVPVATWAEAGRARKKRRRVASDEWRVARVNRCVEFIVVSSFLLNVKEAGGQAGVELRIGELEIEEQAFVQEFLDV